MPLCCSWKRFTLLLETWCSINIKILKKKKLEITEKLYKKGLHDPDNHDGVVTHKHPGMWWQVGLRKHHYKQASGGDGILVELFQILKDDVWKNQYNIVK